MLDEDGYTKPPPEHTTLPGGPRVTLVKKVRSVLWQYLRCRPERRDECWRMAWEWARACADRGDRFNFSRRGMKWPDPHEIASQYLLLAMAKMREFRALRLPFHAAETVTPSIMQRFGETFIGGRAIAVEQVIVGIEHSAPVAQMDGAPLS